MRAIIPETPSFRDNDSAPSMKKIEIDPKKWQQLPGYRRNILLTGADLHSPGSQVQIVTMNPGDSIPGHYHKTSHEVYSVLQGQCTLTVDGQEIILRPGTLLTIEPGDIHQLHNHGREMFELLVFKTNSGQDDTFWIA
jgi:quercetin dioxygenase-like cupin family protein